MSTFLKFAFKPNGFLAAHCFYEKNGFQEVQKADLPASFPLVKVDSKFYCYSI